MNKAIFLDRDGTINIDYGYVYKIEDFHFIDGVVESLKQLNDLAERGNAITAQNVNYGLALIMEHKGTSMVDLDKDLICHTTNGKPIKPKTLGQKKYVEAESNFQKALSCKDSSAEKNAITYYNLSTVMIEQDKKSQALNYAKK